MARRIRILTEEARITERRLKRRGETHLAVSPGTGWPAVVVRVDTKIDEIARRMLNVAATRDRIVRALPTPSVEERTSRDRRLLPGFP